MSLKEIRNKKMMTQKEASELLGVSLRSYKSYENDETKKDTIKYGYFCDKISQYNRVDEEHGVLSLYIIKSVISDILKKYDVNFCYLFGSYAKNKAKETSDVDLLIDSKITGLDFFGLIEELRTSLCKKIDLLKVNQLVNNQELLTEILKDGIKIYG